MKNNDNNKINDFNNDKNAELLMDIIGTIDDDVLNETALLREKYFNNKRTVSSLSDSVKENDKNDSIFKFSHEEPEGNINKAKTTSLPVSRIKRVIPYISAAAVFVLVAGSIYFAMSDSFDKSADSFENAQYLSEATTRVNSLYDGFGAEAEETTAEDSSKRSNDVDMYNAETEDESILNDGHIEGWGIPDSSVDNNIKNIGGGFMMTQDMSVLIYFDTVTESLKTYKLVDEEDYDLYIKDFAIYDDELSVKLHGSTCLYELVADKIELADMNTDIDSFLIYEDENFVRYLYVLNND